eukprot:jgi/Hompol1/1785/HPOL_005735-RA
MLDILRKRQELKRASATSEMSEADRSEFIRRSGILKASADDIYRMLRSQHAKVGSGQSSNNQWTAAAGASQLRWQEQDAKALETIRVLARFLNSAEPVLTSATGSSEIVHGKWMEPTK